MRSNFTLFGIQCHLAQRQTSASTAATAGTNVRRHAKALEPEIRVLMRYQPI
jgi:hypothetical protein